MKFRMYIPFIENLELLKASVTSVVEHMAPFNNEKKPVVILNNSLIPLPEDFPFKEKIKEIILPIEIVPAQQCNLILKLSKDNGEDFALTFHTDAVMKAGAMEDMIEKITEYSDKRWAQINGFGSGVFSALNWQFFYEENVFFDPFLFPFYYLDNHMYMIYKSRGCELIETRRICDGLVDHKSSHYLKENPIFRRKNDLAFPLQGELYIKIWGGLPRHETRIDRTANGTLA